MSDSTTSLEKLAFEEPTSVSMKAIMARRSMKAKRRAIDNSPPDFLAWFLIFAVVIITVFGYPDWSEPHASVHHVWYYGWITAVSTGIGVLPFFFLSEPNKFWMGISNGKYELINLITNLLTKHAQISNGRWNDDCSIIFPCRRRM